MTARFIARETYRRWIMAKGAQGCTDALGFSLSLEPRIPNLQSEMRQPSFKHRRLESFGRCVVLRRRSGRLTGALICRLSTNSGKCWSRPRRGCSLAPATRRAWWQAAGDPIKVAQGGEEAVPGF
jgi:hypothetical protein